MPTIKRNSLLNTPMLIKYLKENPDILNEVIVALRKDKIEQLKANKK